jgi:cytochrome c-type biogenesis protein CcmH/NrfG
VNRDRTLDQIELLNDELTDVDQQLADGDIDEATAVQLRTRYSAELESLIASRTTDLPEADTTHQSGLRLTKRAIVGLLVVGVAVVAVAVFAVTSLTGSGGSGAEGVAGDVLNGEGARDLSTVTNEEMEVVVAQNPDVVPMRLALARRYFEAGEFDKALDHYFEVLDREQHPEALANVGWMTYLSGYPDVAVGYVEASVERDPTFLTARWYLGNIYASLDRTDEAIVMLTFVAEDDQTSAEVRQAALDLISELAAS